MDKHIQLSDVENRTHSIIFVGNLCNYCLKEIQGRPTLQEEHVLFLIKFPPAEAFLKTSQQV